MAAARTAVPGVSVSGVELLAHGWDNVVVLVDDVWVVRFRRDGDLAALTRERAILDAIAGKTELPTPVVVASGSAGSPFIVYRRLEGRPLPKGLAGATRDRAVDQIARFCASLHDALSCADAELAGVNPARPIDPGTLEEGLGLVDEPVRRAIHRAAEIEMDRADRPGDRVFLHNDLHHTNLAWSPTRQEITGVFDFGDARTGDFHRELVPMHQQERFLGQIIAERYGIITGRSIDIERVIAYTVLRCVVDLVATSGEPLSDGHRRAHQWLHELAAL